MKILAIHNFHRKGSASGDDQVYNSETSLLEMNGIDVIKYTVSNDEFDSVGIVKKSLLSFGMLWSFKHYRNVKKLIASEKPDLVHVHTFFPLLSPSILYAAKQSGVKVIATLHDTRFICPCATSLRGAVICNKCSDGHYFRMGKYGCFKNSKIQSLIVAFIFSFHRKKRSFYNQIDKYICLNDDQIRILEKTGFDKNKIVKKYNFVSDNSLVQGGAKGLPERFVVFYGRIGEEKGVRFLMKAWNMMEDIPLVVMGDGPLGGEFDNWAKNKINVSYLGYISHDKCLSIVKKAEFVVFPSIWYEGCSMVEIETESLGKAIVATDLGFSKEAIQNGYNGYKFALGNIESFQNIVKEMWDNPDKCLEMGKNARIDYERKYRPEDNFMKLLEIYNSILES